MIDHSKYSPEIRARAAQSMHEHKPTLHLPGDSARRTLRPSQQMQAATGHSQPSDAGLDEMARRLETSGWTKSSAPTTYRRTGR